MIQISMTPHNCSHCLFSDDNQLTSLPTEIGNLSSLQQLDLGEYYCSGYPLIAHFVSVSENESDINDASQLFSFSFTVDNQLTLLPTEIGNLSSLRNLYLSKLNCFTVLSSKVTRH